VEKVFLQEHLDGIVVHTRLRVKGVTA
jgi:hypothetical protein